ncbi:hypothetical protein P8936_15515 [Edaphobacter paludis]|uniref:Uncharacterized protein n=1 Tax=Edaphobacter paludis TaxID=3035702 RepID=A0AAU7D7G5_9BACT
MNKGTGVVTLGATLLAGMMFQARTRTTPNTDQHEVPNVESTAKFATGEGPWLASRSYWSAARTVDPSSQETSPHGVTIAQTDGLKLQLKPSEDKASCGPNAWNIPRFTDHPTEISTIVATVPDPIHSHLALDFDRSIDAILLAAADNHYVSSNYWLPWRSQISTSSTGESTSTATRPTEEDNARERQPGLIILRYAPDASEWDSRRMNGFEWTNYRRVIYLFLVGETPSLGVNGNQLQKAFSYEKLLRRDCKATLSIPYWSSPQPAETSTQSVNETDNSAPVSALQPGSAADASKNRQPEQPGTTEEPCAKIAAANKVSILGPFYSGSASSLHAGIEAAFPNASEYCVSISGITSTLIAARELDPAGRHIYRSFGENVGFEQERFLQSLAAAGYDLRRVAVLSEALTVYGSNATKPMEQKAEHNTKASAEKGKNARSGHGKAPAAANPSPPNATPSRGSRPSDVDLATKGPILYLRFPRELSLLRNAEASQTSKPNPSAPPTPYLNLSLKDYTADDTVPRFSTNQSPLSIEAQLMAIAHQLQHVRSQFILISASNVLDDIFLAQFLHRACPDARLVILSGGDLLFERDADNTPYIGSISISPYLLSMLDFGEHVQWLHADYQAEAIYNAASFTFWNGPYGDLPHLAGYRNYPVPRKDDPSPPVQFQQIPLWATVIGADGYYPLAVLNWCGSGFDAILPTIWPAKEEPSATPPKAQSFLLGPCMEDSATTVSAKTPPPPTRKIWNDVPESINRNSGISPALLWGILVAFIFLACIGHCVLLLAADFWSPSTRDLAIDHNDLPHRRAVHLNIGTAVLAAIAFVVDYPLLRVGHYFHLALTGHILAWLTLVSALMACICTGWKTRRYLWPKRRPIYRFFNVIALAALVGIIGLWAVICNSDGLEGYHSYAGLYFSYRCLQPLSGVCPLLPILLLLFAWYLWAIYQTARLRFSDIHRPRLPRFTPLAHPYSPSHNAYPLFVPDNTLESCTGSSDNCLYANITCLLITREVIWRFGTKLKSDPGRWPGRVANWARHHLDLVLGCIYGVLFYLCIFATHVHSLDRFIFSTFLWTDAPTFYELLITALFFPLIMVALSGWLRVILIWGSISRGLLEPLERMPIRFAFTRYKGGGWLSMLRQKGLHIRWRDMGRSTEAIRQLVHHPDLKDNTELKKKLSDEYEVINLRIHELIESIHAGGKRESVPSTPPAPPLEVQPPSEVKASVAPTAPAASETLATTLERARQKESPVPSECIWDVPASSADLCSIFHIEQGYARFCTILIDDFLDQYWDEKRTGLVEEVSLPKEKQDEIVKPKEASPSEPSFVELAEELLVIRYVALIRSVLLNIRYLMLFVSAAFVLALIAWNSYPFQPHAFIDWCFTILLALLTLGFVWVFAQMHRNAILSRITDTTANELGWEFYLRLATFGALPVLTWLAYQFPQIGGTLYRIVQPGLQVVK